MVPCHHIALCRVGHMKEVFESLGVGVENFVRSQQSLVEQVAEEEDHLRTEQRDRCLEGHIHLPLPTGASYITGKPKSLEFYHSLPSQLVEPVAPLHAQKVGIGNYHHICVIGVDSTFCSFWPFAFPQHQGVDEVLVEEEQGGEENYDEEACLNGARIGC